MILQPLKFKHPLRLDLVVMGFIDDSLLRNFPPDQEHVLPGSIIRPFCLVNHILSLDKWHFQEIELPTSNRVQSEGFPSPFVGNTSILGFLWMNDIVLNVSSCS